jgi:antitoxin CptB
MTGAADNTIEMRQLRWRCRRGMRELDMLLLNYAERRFSAAGAAEQRAFRTLLSLPDPDILALLTGKLAAEDDQLDAVVQCLLATHSAH